MKILFKDNSRYYCVEDDTFKWFHIRGRSTDLSNVKHLDDAEVLYHYRDTKHDIKFPVLYEHKGKFISIVMIDMDTIASYTIFNVLEHYTKDYTLVNLNLLEDGNII